MYLDYFRLREKPFNTTADPRFLHLTRGHREALAQLVFGVRESKGFLLLTGEVGTGKTTLLRALLERLSPETAVAFVFNSTLPFDEMLEYILEDFGVSQPGTSRAQRLFALNRFLIERRRAGEQAVLILDEAHNLDIPTLEQVRLLSNFETAQEKLLQIILVGQPELREKLKRREMRQLYQRIGLRAQIEPLSDDEVREYINTRLRVAGGRGAQLFTRQALKRIAAYSQGIPRVVNILCDHCLVIGYADEAGTITRGIVEQGIEAGFDLTYSQDVRLDYAFYVPLHFTMPEPPLPIVPLYVNVYLPPQPAPRRCYAWGQTLRRVLDARPERVALVASGGLSHYPGTDRYASPDYEFDRALLASLGEGRGPETARLTGDELDKAGNVELRTWITLLGALGSARAGVLCYEPSWHHGNAVVAWPV